MAGCTSERLRRKTKPSSSTTKQFPRERRRDWSSTAGIKRGPKVLKRRRRPQSCATCLSTQGIGEDDGEVFGLRQHRGQQHRGFRSDLRGAASEKNGPVRDSDPSGARTARAGVSGGSRRFPASQPQGGSVFHELDLCLRDTDRGGHLRGAGSGVRRRQRHVPHQRTAPAREENRHRHKGEGGSRQVPWWVPPPASGLWPKSPTSASSFQARVSFSPTLEQQRKCPGCEGTFINGDFVIKYGVKQEKVLGEVQVCALARLRNRSRSLMLEGDGGCPCWMLAKQLEQTQSTQI